MIRDPIGLTATLAGVTALAFWLESRFRWASRAGAALLVILFGAVLSNARWVPVSSSVYDAVFGPVTSLAIVWLLLAIRLDDLKEAGPRMLAAFAIATLATAVGATVAGLAFSGAFDGESWKLAGVMTGTYSGGSLNFVGVGRALSLPPSLFSAAAASDNVVTAVWMGATLMLPIWLARCYGARMPALSAAQDRDGSRTEAGAVEASRSRGPSVPGAGGLFGTSRPGILDMSVILGIGLLLVWIASTLGAIFPAVPAVLWLTTLALLAGSVPATRRLTGSMQMGYLALHVFFAVIGINSRISEILRVGPEVLYLTVTVVAVHGLLTYGGAWLARLDVRVASVASQAAVGGPSTALALAVARDWPGLALPGVAVGMLGYAAGTYAGLGVA
ncbi:MAG: DUF819 domain-containing protein, partial [Gemmatimonadota bacterium]